MRIYCLLYEKEVEGNSNCIVSPRFLSCVESEGYCKTGYNNCTECAISNYGRDCRNNKI